MGAPEKAPAEAAERAVRLLPLDENLIHAPGGVVTAQHIHQASAGGGGTLRNDLHAPVVEVLGVAGQAHGLGGSGAPPAEAHALHLAAHESDEADFGGFCRGAVGEEIKETHGSSRGHLIVSGLMGASAGGGALIASIASV